MEKAPINKIICFSNVDGPGNRMTIFFQSCPFKCLYCHNPETINLCNSCGKCVSRCPSNALNIINNKVIWDESKCLNCDTCISVCSNFSSPKVKMYSVEDLLKIIIEVKPFIRGITVSGGECCNYPKFLYELFLEVKKLGLTCLIDSNGYYDMEQFNKLILLSNGVMLDVKAIDNQFHKFLTSKENNMVLKNLNYLLNINRLEEVRTVILPNFEKENEKTVLEVSKIIGNKTKYKLIKYRYFGVKEAGILKFGKVITSQDEIDRLKTIIDSNGLQVKIEEK